MSTAHDNARVIDRLAREHERSAQVRATARQSLRNSGSATGITPAMQYVAHVGCRHTIPLCPVVSQFEF